MIIVSDIKNINSHSVTSEAVGYPLSNAINYEKPWLMWRSTSTAAQSITLNYGGSFDSLILLGANFQNINIKAGGWFNGRWFDSSWFGEDQSEILGYLRMMGEYRGLFNLISTVEWFEEGWFEEGWFEEGWFAQNQENSITFEIPNQSTLNGESYFTLWGIIIGNKIELSHQPYWPLDKELILSTNEISLGSLIPKKSALGRKYHIIKLNRKFLNITELNEIRDIKRAKGKCYPFVIYENLNETENVFLVKRIEDFSYNEEGYRNFQDNFILREIA